MRAFAWLFGKDGELSKTAVMLWIAYLAVIFKYIFATQTIPTPWGDFLVGPFDEMEAMTVLSLVSGLYLGSNRIWQHGQTANINKTPKEAPSSPNKAPNDVPPSTESANPLPIAPELFLELLKHLPSPTDKTPAPPLTDPPGEASTLNILPPPKSTPSATAQDLGEGTPPKTVEDELHADKPPGA